MISLFTIFSICSLCLGDVIAYEFPVNSYYIKFIDSSLGEITLYIPTNQIQNISLEKDNKIINTSSSNITAYTNDTEYSISFQPFQTGRYRKANNTDYIFLDVIEVIDTNFPNQSESSFFINSNIDTITTGLLVVGGAFLLLIWLKL